MYSGKELEIDLALQSVKLILKVRDALAEAKSAGNGLGTFESLSDEISSTVGLAARDLLPFEWRILEGGITTLISLTKCTKLAKSGEGDIVSERARRDVLIEEFLVQLASHEFQCPDNLCNALEELLSTGKVSREGLIDFLLHVPIPPIYWKTSRNNIAYLPEGVSTTSLPEDPLISVIVFLDSSPIVAPQLLRPDLLYKLDLRVRGINWPENYSQIEFKFLTTCPANEFSISIFHLQKDDIENEDQFEGCLSGNLKFASAQSSLLEDIVFSITAAFFDYNGNYLEVPLIGHTEIRLRVVNSSNHPFMSGNRRLDRHVEELLVKLINDSPSINDELDELIPMVQALTGLVSAYAQEAVFKGRTKVPESEFQKLVLRDLRVKLGQDVHEQPKQCGGITDIRYRGLILELKVVKESADRAELCRRYSAQPTQYSGVEARQVSIVLVLDLAEKVAPPGDIRNNFSLVGVKTHGGDDSSKPFPSKAIVIFVDGNLKNPSDYSKR